MCFSFVVCVEKFGPLLDGLMKLRAAHLATPKSFAFKTSLIISSAGQRGLILRSSHAL